MRHYGTREATWEASTVGETAAAGERARGGGGSCEDDDGAGDTCPFPFLIFLIFATAAVFEFFLVSNQLQIL